MHHLAFAIVIPDGFSAVSIEGENALERLAVIAVVGVFRVGEGQVALHSGGDAGVLPYFQQVSHSANQRRRTEQEGIDEAEDCDVHADSERQGNDNGGVRGGLLHHHAQAEANVSPPLHGREEAALGALLLLQQCDVAKLKTRGFGGFEARHALAEIALGEVVEVSLNFLVEFVVFALLREKALDLCCPHSQKSHRLIPAFPGAARAR